MGSLEVVSFVMFPTMITDNVEVSVEQGNSMYLNISKDDSKIKLKDEEIIELKKILDGFKSAKSTNKSRGEV